ncbi:MAG: T9SS type A sorting domain-containing protein [Crocinitomicaceae bacterium]|nr:T9SS type A sorting domain-containing protein [Crocinitomicaceae bacterium]
MKLLLFLLLLVLPILSNAQDTWSIKDSVNGAPRSVSSSFVLGGEAYIVGGLDENGFRRKMYSYTFSQDDWDQEESLGGLNGSGLNRGSACAFTIGSKSYVCLGQGDLNGFFQDTWEYDLVTQTWAQKADFAGGQRRQAACFVIDNVPYVGTGIAPDGLKKDMYKYDYVTNSWTQIADFGGTARKEAAAFQMGAQGYMGTGDDGIMRDDFWQYEPTSDTWTQKANFPGTARKGAAAWGIFPSGFICTGEDINFTYTSDLWEYNYYTDSWMQRANFIGPGRTNAIAFVLNDIAFVGTGFNGEFLDDLYAYNRVLETSETDKITFSIYPNPATNSVSIKLDEVNTEISISTADGKKINTDIHLSNSFEGYTFERNELPAGTYFVSISSKEGNRTSVQKIIFQ